MSRLLAQVGPERMVDILDPRPNDINIEDIARSLSRLCRFNGHIADEIVHYSVAQHSVLVSRLCSPEHALIGLLHDATEAYLGDVITPVKQCLHNYDELEWRWSLAIDHAFHLGGELARPPEDVLEADRMALAWEARDLMHSGQGRDLLSQGPLPPAALGMRLKGHDAPFARGQFLKRYLELAAEHFGDDDEEGPTP